MDNKLFGWCMFCDEPLADAVFGIHDACYQWYQEQQEKKVDDEREKTNGTNQTAEN